MVDVEKGHIVFIPMKVGGGASLSEGIRGLKVSGGLHPGLI